MFLLFLFLFPIFHWVYPHGSKTNYVDLTYPIDNHTVYYPGQKVTFELRKDIQQYTDAGFWYASFSMCLGEHGGTHIDAPYHFYEKGWTLDQIPPSHLIDIHGTLIDVEDQVFSFPSPNDFILKVEHLLQHESTHGKIRSGGVVLLYTGWSRYWLDYVKYLGWDNSSMAKESAPKLNFPGCSLEAAKWLKNERNIVGFGIDTASVDVGDSKGNFVVHDFFAKAEVYNLENVANLHEVKKLMKEKDGKCDLHLFVLPLKVTGGTGGPTRILAYCKH